MKRRLATIDIGTNTLLMLVAEAGTDGKITVLDDFHRIARLGEKVNETGVICETAKERALAILRGYSAYLRENGVMLADVTGTSALRDSLNGPSVAAEFAALLGAPVRIISGEEEAVLTFAGSIMSGKHSAVIDIGGGSTEVVIGKGRDLGFKRSFQIGAVRLTEMFVRHDPMLPGEIAALTLHIEQVMDLRGIPPFEEAVAVAGTPSTLAQIHLGLKDFDYKAIHGHRISAPALSEIVREVSSRPKKELAASYGVHPDRADIIAGGAFILDAFCHLSGTEGIIVSCHGLRYGSLYEYLNTFHHSV